MKAILTWLEVSFRGIPLPLLETWGRFSYVLALALAVFAFGGFTFRVGDRWGIGRERQSWDAKALLSMSLTFVIIVASGYLGSSIVLVAGAQTFESLKDLSVFLCIVLFGYPALITTPFAYGLSDIVEGVPPEYLVAWSLGYVMNPAFFWVAYQLLGKRPDFRRVATWSRYVLFVAVFMALEPALWGFMCSPEFTSEISYRNITPALFFTTAITWTLAPFAMLVAWPAARRLGLFWADIEGHVQERFLNRQEAAWESGSRPPQKLRRRTDGLPIRVVLLTPFIVLLLTTFAATAYSTLRSADNDINKLAMRLHEEVSQNINLQLDEYLARSSRDPAEVAHDLELMLRRLSISRHGRAFILTRDGAIVAPSVAADPVVQRATAALREELGPLNGLQAAAAFTFDHVTAKPLSRETWLARVTPYQDTRGGHLDWLLITLTPRSFYLAEIRAGNSHWAMLFALALLLSLAVAAVLASLVTAPLRHIASATQALRSGDLTRRVPRSRLDELDAVSHAFNEMAEQLTSSFAELRQEVEARKAREQALAQSEQRLQLATRAARMGIWDWDIVRDEIVWDDTMYELYGLERGSFRGAYEAWLRCLAPEEFQQATAAVDAALRGEREFSIEFRVQKGDGTAAVLRGIAQTIRDENGKPLRMVGVNWDVSERHQTESELRKHRAHLEELVHERTLALEQAKEQADAANRAKSAFLANMSHEIRTPMNAILGFGQLMERQSDLSARDRERLARIMASGRHLLELINAVLEMSKIEAGRTTLLLEPFDLVALLDDVKLMFGELIGAKGVAVVFELADDLPRGVLGDAAKVRQVIINLLSNAAKFTQVGRIALRARADVLAEGRVLIEIRVEDTGAGIEPTSLERIFGAFDQSASGARGGGTGLGLTISRSFARLMDGDLVVHSTPGAGSMFTFTFLARLSGAVAQPRTDLRPVRLSVQPGRAWPKVLVVDDEPVNAELMIDLLSQIGFEVRAASNGQQALELDASFQPELVLMDLQMPGMDGFAATRALRERGTKAAIIAFTASALAESEPDALAAGADAFLRKPYREAELLARIAQVLDLPCTSEELPKPAPPAEEAPALAKLVSSLPAELVAQLREATIQARAERIERLTERAAEHSEAAAGQIRALARSFQYEKLLAAFESRI